MILSERVKIKVTNNISDHYKKLGYDIIKNGQEIEIPICHLLKGSKALIKIKCDICGLEKELNYYRYNQNILKWNIYACSRKCSEVKNKMTIREKYDTDNVSKLESIKIKKQETCFKNYGVNYPMESKEIFHRGEITKEVKYGNKNYNNLEKLKKTSLEKYGTDFPSQNIKVKEKSKKKSELYYEKRILNDYNKINIISVDLTNKEYTFKCDCGENHNFIIDGRLFNHRYSAKTSICTRCNPINKNESGLEIKLRSFIENNYIGEIESQNKNIIKPYEIDIYLPELKLGFEFNGLYWHNELNKEKNYHLNKTEDCEKQGIKLIHIYEDDWNFKQEIIKSKILDLLGKSKKIYGIECEIREIYDELPSCFLDNNHLQGDIDSKIKIGLFYKNELVSLMTLKPSNKYRKKNLKELYELLRFCNKLNMKIVGGENKLFEYFIKEYNPGGVISYSDRSWYNNGLYEKLGFELISTTQPNYHHIINGIRKNISEIDESNKTSGKINEKFYKIYDSGNLKFKYEIC